MYCCATGLETSHVSLFCFLKGDREEDIPASRRQLALFYWLYWIRPYSSSLSSFKCTVVGRGGGERLERQLVLSVN